MDDKEYLHNLRHSAAHLLAQAVLELYPDTKLTIGPVTEHGFFYDFLPSKNFKEDDLPRIEEKMRELVKRDYKITGKQIPKEQARPYFKDNQFKQEIIDIVEDDTVGVYWQGEFYDLCKGGHVDSIGQIKNFKLTAISGAYWRGDRDGIALQRISGVAFATKQDLDDYLKRVEEAQLYDHRRLGKQLDLFSFHDVAPGLPFFHHKGLTIYRELVGFLRKLLIERDYQEIATPQIMNEQLWKTSGHYDNYKDHMYFTQVDEENFCVRPMNCPGSILLYKERPHSYRELPLRLSEFGFVNRYELSGVMHGLFRVRGFTIDDAHIYCMPDQIEEEIKQLIELSKKIYETFEFKKVDMAVSTRPEKYIGSDEVWEKATNALKGALEKSGMDYKVQEGEGAFYGPKIEMKIHDAMGREWQCGTIQVDFVQADNFELEYIDSDQSRKKPVIIHRALLGSVERFMGILLEHYKGHLPFWLSPLQVRVLTITDQQVEYAQAVCKKLRAAGIRAELDRSGDQISAQVRRAQVDKVPWMLVIGKKEVEQNTVTLRHTDGKQEFGQTLESILDRAKELMNV
ncbi:MAG: threonine--tRNA ligase [Epsilonproteobacteria bacterium]|nr:threonine--tRNA ligase [Campylobacterota bacterium]